MSSDPKNHSFVSFTTTSTDATIPYTILVAAAVDPTMKLDLPAVAVHEVGAKRSAAAKLHVSWTSHSTG
jgi:hypothetical protein